jgi:flagellar biogenesis protein FliO
MRLTRSIPLALGVLSCVASTAHASSAALANPVDPTVADQHDPASTQFTKQEVRLGTDAFGPMVTPPTGAEQQANPLETEQQESAGGTESPTDVSGVSDPPATISDDPVLKTSTPSQDDPASIDPPDASADASDKGGIPLGRPADRSIFGDEGDRASATDPNQGWILRTAGSLAVVIALIVACRYAMQWLERRAGGASGFSTQAGAPSGLAEVLARYTVSKGTKLLLLKINARILVVSQTGEGMQTLSEITDPDEVASILIKTRDEEGASEASRFTQMLREMERDPSVAGEYGDFRSPRRALVESSLPSEADEQATDEPEDGATQLRNRLSRLGDLSA